MTQKLILYLTLCLILASCEKETNTYIPEKKTSYFTNDFSNYYPLTIDSSSWNDVPRKMLLNYQQDEVSGIIPSVKNSGAYWLIEDSGSTARLLLYSNEGEIIGKYLFSGNGVRDMEDIAIVRQSGSVATIYIGDIGDNNKARKNIKVIILPEIKINNAEQEAESVEIVEIFYPVNKTGKIDKQDCEAFFVDPVSKNMYFFAKNASRANIYKLKYPYNASGQDTLIHIGEFNIPGKKITAADINLEGSKILVKTYENVYAWERHGVESIDSVLTREPKLLPYQGEVKGEAVCYAANGKSYVTISEKDYGIPVSLNFYDEK